MDQRHPLMQPDFDGEKALDPATRLALKQSERRLSMQAAFHLVNMALLHPGASERTLRDYLERVHAELEEGLK